MDNNETLFKADAQQIVDMLFNSGVFAPHITREAMRDIEDYINFCMVSKYNFNHKVDKYLEKLPKQVENQSNNT